MLITKLGKWLGIELVEVSIAERIVSALGGGLAIGVLIFCTQSAFPEREAMAVITSMGASAVLLFGVPHGPLSQPWPVLAGQGISAAIGVTCARWIPHPALASACAVGLSIGAMLQFKCIHPPGGATAFTAVLGGSAIQSLGYNFVLFPVLINALGMVVLAVVINSFFGWRRYPAYWNTSPSKAAKPKTKAEPQPSHEAILAAVRSLDSFVDISEEDLLRLIELLRQPVDQTTAPRSSTLVNTPPINSKRLPQD